MSSENGKETGSVVEEGPDGMYETSSQIERATVFSLLRLRLRRHSYSGRFSRATVNFSCSQSDAEYIFVVSVFVLRTIKCSKNVLRLYRALKIMQNGEAFGWEAFLWKIRKIGW